MTATRLLSTAAALLVASGIALRVAPIGRPATAAPLTLGPVAHDHGRVAVVPAQTAALGRSGTTDDPLIAANIFSPRRVAPPRSTAVAATALPKPKPPPRAPTLTLYGTTIGPRGAVALIEASTTPGGAQLYDTGAFIAGARLVAVTESTATLARLGGPVVLHVPSATGRKP